MACGLLLSNQLGSRINFQEVVFKQILVVRFACVFVFEVGWFKVEKKTIGISIVPYLNMGISTFIYYILP